MKKLSPQTLSEADRRLVAGWAADCAESVLDIFESEVPNDDRPRNLIKRALAFSDGVSDTADDIRNRFKGGVGVDEVKSESALLAARSAGQASAVSHMGAHGLGAAAYAVRAIDAANVDSLKAAEDEIRWQIAHMSEDVQAALKTLPMVGENSSGPLGPGLLSKGKTGAIIREIQESLARES